MPPQDFGTPDSYVREGGYVRLFARPAGEWSIETGDGIQVGTLIASDPDLGDAEWYFVTDALPEPDGYWPSWRAALDAFLDTLG
jgi:hypothetical protein